MQPPHRPAACLASAQPPSRLALRWLGNKHDGGSELRSEDLAASGSDTDLVCHTGWFEQAMSYLEKCETRNARTEPSRREEGDK